jgi:hypothetical protein
MKTKKARKRKKKKVYYLLADYVFALALRRFWRKYKKWFE